MTFEEFISTLQHDIETFKNHWVEEHNYRGPEQYPMEMSEGEWYEQFDAWWRLQTE